MIETLPTYITAVFVLTTVLTIGLLFRSFRKIRPPGLPSFLLFFAVPFWMIFTAVLATGGFYRQFDAFPPRVFLFGVMPAALLIAAYFLFFRESFIDRLSLRTLTLLHVVRLPVELVLLWLFQHGWVPQIMTFEGWNFDILSGLTAPVVYWLAFRGNNPNRPLLIGWNVAALALLANIVTIAVLAFPTPAQRLGFEQPNVGPAYFPFIWLPAIIVPVVLFAHLAAIRQLMIARSNK